MDRVHANQNEIQDEFGESDPRGVSNAVATVNHLHPQTENWRFPPIPSIPLPTFSFPTTMKSSWRDLQDLHRREGDKEAFWLHLPKVGCPRQR